MSPTACCQHSSPRDPLRTEVRPGVHAPGALVSPQNRTQDQKRGSPGPTRSGPRPLSELTSPLTPHPAARPPAGPQPAHVLLAPYPGLRTPHLTPHPPHGPPRAPCRAVLSTTRHYLPFPSVEGSTCLIFLHHRHWPHRPRDRFTCAVRSPPHPAPVLWFFAVPLARGRRSVFEE